MEDSNVGATARVMAAAEAAGVARIVYVSTVNVFGDTHGEVVDETYRRDIGQGFLSWYDETNTGPPRRGGADRRRSARAHRHARPGLRSRRSHECRRTARGAFRGRLPYLVLSDLGICLAHVDDLAAGLLAAVDRGRIGQSYVLDGEPVRPSSTRSGSPPGSATGDCPACRSPDPAPAADRPAVRPLGGRLGLPANLAEVISAADGVTYWASHAKASAELGFDPRTLEAGLRDTFGAA